MTFKQLQDQTLDYCQEIADKVVKFDCSKADKYISVLEKFLEDITSSKIFHSCTRTIE